MIHGDSGSMGNSEIPLTQMPDMKTVVTAINTVLSCDPSIDKKPATKWLESLRNSIFAWKVCDELLMANQCPESCYIAANMLKHKIDRQFNELPLDCYSSLKDSILNHIQRIQDAPVQGQLAEATVKLTILLSQWVNPIEDVAQRLNLNYTLSDSRQDQATLCRALTNRYIFADILEQITIPLDHFCSGGVRIGANRREEFEDYLTTKCSQVIDWWLSTLRESKDLKQEINNSLALDPSICDADLKKSILKNLSLIDKLVGKIYQCYRSWTKIMRTDDLDKCIPLVDAAFTDLRDFNCAEYLHDFAVEVVVTLSELCYETSKHQKHLMDYLVDQVFTLEEAYMKSVANEENAKSSNYTKVFTDVAETACRSLVSTNNILMHKNFKLVELLLKCLEHYDFEVVEVTFGFWWRFVDEIQNSSNNSKNPQFEDAINKLIMALIKLCQCDPDLETVITTELELDGFRCRTKDLIKHALFLTDGSDFIAKNNIMNLLNPDLRTPWEKVEAILFLMSCTIDNLEDKENSIKRELLIIMLSSQTFTSNIMELLENKRELVLKIGCASGEVHPQIISTTSKILGQLQEYFQRDPTFLELSIKYLLSAISNPAYRTQLARESASSLAKIIQANASRHLTNSPGLVAILTDLCANLDHLGDEEAARESLRCCAAISQSIVDSSIRDQFLCQIIRPNLAALLNTLNIQPSVGMKYDEELPSKYLDRLANLFRELDLPHTDIGNLCPNLISLIETELWPTLLKTLQKYASENGYAIERSCRTIRYILRSVKPIWMAPRVAETMVDLYRSYPQNSSPLYVASILVDEFVNRSPEMKTVLFKMLDAFCALTFTLLNMEGTSAQSLLSMKNYPETIDDMMRLFNRFIEKCPEEFVACQAIQSIIDLSISSIRLDHREANQTLVKFLVHFIELGLPDKSLAQIRDAVTSHLGARLVDAVIKACLFDLPTHFITDEADILYLLLQYDRNLFISWIEATVSTLPSTNIQGIVSVTNEQFEDFKKTMSSAKSVKQIVTGVRFLARLYQ